MWNLSNHKEWHFIVTTMDASLALLSKGEQKKIAEKKWVANGATGWFGKWLIASWRRLQEMHPNETGELCIVMKNKESRSRIYQECSWVEGVKNIRWISETDFLSKDYYTLSDVSGLWHMDASSNAEKNGLMPSRAMDEMLMSLRNWAGWSKRASVKMLYVSSGAVYGFKKKGLLLKEDQDAYGFSLNQNVGYHHGKRACESWLNLWAVDHGINYNVTRPFAFGGGYLPLKSHFAMGMFINNALNGEDIVINGDGENARSYLGMSDLIVWHWGIMLRGESGHCYNVGSDEVLSLREWAEMIRAESGLKMNIIVKNLSHGSDDFYIPNIEKARAIGLKITESKKELVENMFKWLKGSIK